MASPPSNSSQFLLTSSLIKKIMLLRGNNKMKQQNKIKTIILLDKTDKQKNPREGTRFRDLLVHILRNATKTL